jgi:hypothetical protein
LELIRPSTRFTRNLESGQRQRVCCEPLKFNQGDLHYEESINVNRDGPTVRWDSNGCDAPKVETFLGYTFLRANSATNIPAFSANGAGGQFAYNFNSWLGGVADLTGVHNDNVFGSATINGVTYPGGKLDNTSFFYQFGPRVSIRKWSRITPFFQILMGAQSVSASVPVTLPAGSAVIVPVPGGALTLLPSGTNPAQLRANTSQSSFAYLLGGGLDIKINRHWSFRPIGADLQYMRLQQLRSPQSDKSQYNFRYTTGINFTFGGPQ